eukprot:m.60050 g.60050  ORF g.60050 m.60050 type:complete len:135 (+) comp15729_c0_seq1:222-626(+)
MVAGKSTNDARVAGGMRLPAPRRSARFLERAAAAAQAAAESAAGKTQVESTAADVSSPLQGVNPAPEVANQEQQEQIVEEKKHQFVPKPRAPKIPKNNAKRGKPISNARKSGSTFQRGGDSVQRPQNIGTNGWA